MAFKESLRFPRILAVDWVFIIYKPGLLRQSIPSLMVEKKREDSSSVDRARGLSSGCHGCDLCSSPVLPCWWVSVLCDLLDGSHGFPSISLCEKIVSCPPRDLSPKRTRGALAQSVERMPSCGSHR